MSRKTTRKTQVDFNGKTLSLKATYSKDYEQPYTYVLCLSATLDGAEVAGSNSIVVMKEHCRGGDFHEIMDIRSDETQKFATTLFDGRGRLRHQFFREGSARRGTGVWGQELDNGSLAFVEDVYVLKEYRRQGYAKWMLQQVLSQPELQSCKFAYAWPCADGEFSREERGVISDIIGHIFSSAGFRRVGRTEYVAYALGDPDHPSRGIPAASDPTFFKDKDDAVDQLLTPDEMNHLTPEEQDDRKISVLASRFPFHYAIVNQEGDALMETFSQLTTGNPALLRSRDVSGSTPLHVAVSKYRTTLIAKLLETEAKADVSITDLQGRTPLQLLDEQLTSNREFMRAIGIPFNGHAEDSVATRRLLLTALERPIPTSIQMKFGCTCGQCLFGFLSPRMRLRLTTTAEVASDVIPDSMPVVIPREPIDPSLMDTIYLAGYIPREIRAGPVYATYIKCYARCFSVAANLLRQEILPTEAAIGRDIERNNSEFRHMGHYFQHGGRIEHALNALVSRAQEEADEGDENILEALEDLPTCMNDNDYGTIHKQLGLSGQLVGEDLADLDQVENDWDDDGDEDELMDSDESSD